MTSASLFRDGMQTVSAERAKILRRRISIIVAFTICYNVIEAVVAILAGTMADSGALIGFGLDSTIEVTSALAVAWQMSRADPGRWEKPVLKVIACAFFALAAFVAFDSITTLISREAPAHSSLGIAIAALSVVIMPFVSYLERQAGLELGSATAVADSKQTLICTYLSIAVLAGLLLNALLGWWWADPVAALVIAVLAVREGKEAWEGDGCASAKGNALCGGEGEACTDHCCGSK